MGIGFMIMLPVIFWAFIVMLVIAVSKPKRRPGQTVGRSRSRPGNFTKPRQTVRTSAARPKMQEGLFDMNLGNKGEKKKGLSAGSFRNSDFDDYSAKGRKKDFVSGYDRKLAKGSYSHRRAATVQYSHTYDGHEPWDKCLPKEKDPWDKDFYV